MSESEPKDSRLSALVVAHDEEAQLAECLECLDFCDEIVVLLDRCSDRSQAIAEGLGARVVAGAWPLEGDRRNHGTAACKGDWVLEVDADERVPPELAAEIRQAIGRQDIDLYNIPLRNYVGRRWVRHGWGQNVGVRSKPVLFRKGVKRWGGERVHPGLAFPPNLRRGPRLVAAIDHFVDRDVSDLIRRIDRYTSAQAADLRDSGNIGSPWNCYRQLVSRFLRAYIGRAGYREGMLGLLLAILAGVSPLIAYLKARGD
jgi:glycosyltransferase involved in cell wall biosynthesis